MGLLGIAGMGLARLGRRLKPDLWVDSPLWGLQLECLRERGIRALIIDLDNTVTCWNSREVAAETLAWFRQAEETGFAICLNSNNGYTRGMPVARLLGVPLVGNAVKPMRKAFYQAMKIMGSQPSETAVVGDQIFTDILGGKRAGLFTVLVSPVSPCELITTRAVRGLEGLVKDWWRRQEDKG